MGEPTGNADAAVTAEAPAPAPAIHVAPSPHVYDTSLTTRKMMINVLIALAPVVGMSLYVFRLYALKHIALCMGSCLAAELLFTAMRGRKITLGDCSAAVTGLILALSLPGAAPWYVSVIGSFAAIGIGKVLFGGLGQNIFNPAMVGRAFVMLAFAGAVGASGYVLTERRLPARAASTSQAAMVHARTARADVMTQATPMTVARKAGRGEKLSDNEAMPSRLDLFLGTVNGSLGETSALWCLVGGLYLCLRRTASWQIPAGMLLAVVVIAGVIQLVSEPQLTVLDHLLGGALLFGAFFIATDLVTSPLTRKGKFIFGLGVGSLVMLFRTLSNYPEGVMFAVLVMNGVVPLINRWTIPTPVGGPTPVKRE
ncbi:MAG: RnfABCDGE type electron transport complex subunit D [Phycisphaerae bacterium]